jgi:hypothetical protein
MGKAETKRVHKPLRRREPSGSATSQTQGLLLGNHMDKAEIKGIIAFLNDVHEGICGCNWLPSHRS